MDYNKLYLIVNDDESYLMDEVDKLRGLLKINNLKKITEWSKGVSQATNLFGNTQPIHLDLSDTNNFKKFVKFIKDNPEEFEGERWFINVVIITAKNMNRTTTVKKLVEKANGVVDIKAELQKEKEDYLKGLPLQKNVKESILFYLGDDYAQLIPLKRALQGKTQEEIAEMSFGDILSVMPNIKGKVKPWEFVEYLFKDDINRAIVSAKRLSSLTSPKLALNILKNNIDNIYASAQLRKTGKYKLKDQAAVLGLKTGQMYNAFSIGRLISDEEAEKLCSIIYKTEVVLTGGSKEDDLLYIMKTIAEVYNIISKYLNR